MTDKYLQTIFWMGEETKGRWPKAGHRAWEVLDYAFGPTSLSALSRIAKVSVGTMHNWATDDNASLKSEEEAKRIASIADWENVAYITEGIGESPADRRDVELVNSPGKSVDILIPDGVDSKHMSTISGPRKAIRCMPWTGEKHNGLYVATSRLGTKIPRGSVAIFSPRALEHGHVVRVYGDPEDTIRIYGEINREGWLFATDDDDAPIKSADASIKGVCVEVIESPWGYPEVHFIYNGGLKLEIFSKKVA